MLSPARFRGLLLHASSGIAHHRWAADSLQSINEQHGINAQHEQHGVGLLMMWHNTRKGFITGATKTAWMCTLHVAMFLLQPLDAAQQATHEHAAPIVFLTF